MGNLNLENKCLKNWSIKMLKQRPDLVKLVINPYYGNIEPETILHILVIEAIEKIEAIVSEGILKRAQESYEQMVSNYNNLTFMEKAFFDSRKRSTCRIHFYNTYPPISHTIYKKYIVTNEDDVNSGLVDKKGKIFITDKSLSDPDKYFDKETAEKIKKLNLDDISWMPIYGILWRQELYFNQKGAEGDFWKAKPIAEKFLNDYEFNEEEFDKYYPNSKRLKEILMEEENTEEVI